MFEKRVYIFKKRDRETWDRIRTVLKEAGLTGVKSGHYLQETVMGGGCGAKLDPRDFGGHGRIDREIYWVKVIQGDEKKAGENCGGSRGECPSGRGSQEAAGGSVLVIIAKDFIFFL